MFARHRRGYLITVLLACALRAAAQGSNVEFSSSLDWEHGVITTEARVDLSTLDGPLPTVRNRAMALVEAALPLQLVSELGDLAVNSIATVSELASRSPMILEQLRSFADAGKPLQSHVSPDLRTLIVTYRYELFPGLARIFVRHTRAYPLKPYLGFYPTTGFSGIVIYAKGAYAVHGEEDATAELAPAIMPRIYDESMHLVFEAEMVEPGLATGRGVVGYTTSERLLDARDRVGDVPLVTMAREIYGTNRTDLVIPDEAAARILASDANRALLRNAKIMIICDLSR